MLYKTSDTFLASALASFGHRDFTMEIKNKIITFCFQDSQELQDHIQEFWQGQLSSLAKEYEALRKRMKELTVNSR